MDNPKSFWPLPKREKAKFTHRYGYYECRCRLMEAKIKDNGGGCVRSRSS